MTTTTFAELYDNYKGNEVFVLEAAAYELEVIGVSVKDTHITPSYKVISGPYAGKRVMAGQFSVAGNAAGIFFQNMRGFGLNEEFFGPLKAMNLSTKQMLDEVAKALKGRVARVELYQNEWPKGSGQYRNKVSIGKIQLISAPAFTASPVPGIPAPVAAPAAVPTPDTVTVVDEPGF